MEYLLMDNKTEKPICLFDAVHIHGAKHKLKQMGIPLENTTLYAKCAGE